MRYILFFLLLSALCTQSVLGQIGGGDFKYFGAFNHQFSRVSYKGIDFNYGLAKRFISQHKTNSHFKVNNGIKPSSIGTSLTTHNLYSSVITPSIYMEYQNWSGMHVGINGLRINSKFKGRYLSISTQVRGQNSLNDLEKQHIDNRSLGYNIDLSLNHKSRRWSHRTDFIVEHEQRELRIEHDTLSLNTNQSILAVNHTSEYELSLNNTIKAEVGGLYFTGDFDILGSDFNATQAAFSSSIRLKQRKPKYNLWNGFKWQTFSSDALTKQSNSWFEYNNLLNLFDRRLISVSVNNSLALVQARGLVYMPQVALKWRKNRFYGRAHLGRVLNRLSNSLDISPFWILDSVGGGNVITHSAFGSVYHVRNHLQAQFSANYQSWDNFTFLNRSLRETVTLRTAAAYNRNRYRISGVYEIVPYRAGQASSLIPQHKASLTFGYDNLGYSYRTRQRRSGNKSYSITASVNYRSQQGLILENQLSNRKTRERLYLDLGLYYIPRKWVIKKRANRIIFSLRTKNLTRTRSLKIEFGKDASLLFSNAWILRPEYSFRIQYKIMTQVNRYGKYGF